MSSTHSYEFFGYLSGGPARLKIARMSILGDKLRELRQAHKPPLTQEDMAERLCMLPNNYNYYETGYKLPSDDTLERISEILETDFKTLLRFKQADAISKKYSPDVIELAFKALEVLSEYPDDEVKEAIARVKAKKKRTE